MVFTAYKLPDLSFAFGDLEPYIDTETMKLHHDKHHNGYVTNLNSALKKTPEAAELPLEELLKDLSRVPEDVRTAVRNNGGGHFNHTLFWKILSPGGANPGGELEKAVARDFGSVEDLIDKFSAAAMGRFGSGWAWLSTDNSGKLYVHSTPNQDTPLAEGLRPVFGLDVWEHAYYLNYQNRRADYVKAFWNILNWDNAESIYRDGFSV